MTTQKTLTEINSKKYQALCRREDIYFSSTHNKIKQRAMTTTRKEQ